MVAEVHAVRGPRIEVIAGGDRSTDPPLLTHAPVLVERARAFDGRLVDALRAIDVIGAAVAGHRAHEPLSARRTVRAPALDDVVLDERILRPSVERQVAVARRIEAA